MTANRLKFKYTVNGDELISDWRIITHKAVAKAYQSGVMDDMVEAIFIRLGVM